VIDFIHYYIFVPSVSLLLPQTNDKAGKTAIYVIHKVIKYLLPQWAILTIFYPVKRKSLFNNDANVEDTETLSWIDKPVSVLSAIIITYSVIYGVIMRKFRASIEPF
jgi:hypothetical protein